MTFPVASWQLVLAADGASDNRWLAGAVARLPAQRFRSLHQLLAEVEKQAGRTRSPGRPSGAVSTGSSPSDEQT
ncbi:hypothetical protein [Actinomycetospora soli]|uniref:hypothetical protein n=1 Tax=Actinomycetospora soli TaxID=2893887 RepID=UPI001E30F317|nr:hypothetical protein [Actinomycetospora soli]MCD2191138.1 hypothetical protein [Actinomycetospora soli]